MQNLKSLYQKMWSGEEPTDGRNNDRRFMIALAHFAMMLKRAQCTDFSDRVKNTFYYVNLITHSHN